jgi:hypothetical protein
MSARGGSPVASAAWAYTASSEPLSYSIFSKCGIIHLRIDAVACEASAQLVVDAAFAHPPQRESCHVKCLQVGLVPGGARAPVAQQALDESRMREFGRPPNPPKSASKLGASGVRANSLSGAAESIASAAEGRRGLRSSKARRRASLCSRSGLVLAVVLRHALQHLAERWHAVTRGVRKVRAAEKRPLIIRREEHRERPAARALRQHLLGYLIDAIHIGPLFAIDFDVDEIIIQEPRSLSSSKLSSERRGTSACCITDA